MVITEKTVVKRLTVFTCKSVTLLTVGHSTDVFVLGTNNFTFLFNHFGF